MASVVVGLLGKSGAGKDTVAARLVEKHGFTRVAFADPLKAAALQINPIITDGHHFARLATMVDVSGWDEAKKIYEVRRFLQNLAESMRALDEDIWLNAGMDKISYIDGPVVVTDVRYVNEALGIHSPDNYLARVVRPGAGLEGAAAQHVSEKALDGYDVDLTIVNDRTIGALNARVDAMVLDFGLTGVL